MTYDHLKTTLHVPSPNENLSPKNFEPGLPVSDTTATCYATYLSSFSFPSFYRQSEYEGYLKSSSGDW